MSITSPALGGLLCLVLFGLTEVVLRRGQAARSLEAGALDRNTSLQIVVSYILAIGLLVFGSYLNIALLPPALRWVGLGVAVCGLAFRWWAMAVLGRFYTRTLRITDDHAIVDYGPYRYIRHPGYLGSLLIWIGASCAIASPLIATAIALILGVAYIRRISQEEAMLSESLGAVYDAFRQRTWRLLPMIY